MKIIIWLVAIGVYASLHAQTKKDIYRNSIDSIKGQIPNNWPEKKFILSKNYPSSVSTPQNFPWVGIDFTKEPQKYLDAVLGYFMTDENIKKEFRFGEEAAPSWFHAPAMALDRQKGREFIHGLTSERNSERRELHPKQDSSVQNWAVGFYNQIGAVGLKAFWDKKLSEQNTNAHFAPNTVSVKLLFTNASDSQVPYLKTAPVWNANILQGVNRYNNPRTVQKVRLIQVDIAIKYNITHWLFGTYIYQNNITAFSPWRKLLCVGVASSEGLNWVNPAYKTRRDIIRKETTSGHYNNGVLKLGGGNDSLVNGPVDNPKSSCLMCHSKRSNRFDFSLQLEAGENDFDLSALKTPSKMSSQEAYTHNKQWTYWTWIGLIGISMLLSFVIFSKK